MPSWIIAVGLYGNFMIFMGTIWLFNIAMENGPFIDGLPIKKWWFSMAMLNNQMVFVFKYSFNGSSTGHHWNITHSRPGLPCTLHRIGHCKPQPVVVMWVGPTTGTVWNCTVVVVFHPELSALFLAAEYPNIVWSLFPKTEASDSSSSSNTSVKACIQSENSKEGILCVTRRGRQQAATN